MTGRTTQLRSYQDEKSSFFDTQITLLIYCDRSVLQSDRIKIITRSQYFTIPPDSDFVTNVHKKSGMMFEKYVTKTPYFLSIMINKVTDRTTVEFTSKILGERCIELLSIRNIQDCLELISQKGICQIESEKVMVDATVSRIDVTMDLDIQMTNEMKTVLQMAIKDSGKWESKIRKNDGIDIKKDVKSDSRRKERISFYNKGKEIHRSRNRPFLNSLSNTDRIIEYFTMKTRVEYNFTSGTMIREILQIENLNLTTVLGCEVNPIAKLCDKILDRSLLENLEHGKLNYLLFDSIQEFYRHLLLEKYGDDYSSIDRVLRHFYSPKTNLRVIRRQLKRTLNKRIGAGQNFENHLELFDNVMNKIKQAA